MQIKYLIYLDTGHNRANVMQRRLARGERAVLFNSVKTHKFPRGTRGWILQAQTWARHPEGFARAQGLARMGRSGFGPVTRTELSESLRLAK